MDVLEDVLGAGLLGMLAVPGFVFIALRSLLRGPRGTQDTELSSRIATSLLVSVVFNAGYLIVASLLLGEAQLVRLLREGDDIAIRSPMGILLNG